MCKSRYVSVNIFQQKNIKFIDFIDFLDFLDFINFVDLILSEKDLNIDILYPFNK